MRSKAKLQSKFKRCMSKPMSKAELRSKLRQYMSKPARALHKAKEFYVKSMEECANKVGHGGVIGCAAAPRSFGVNYYSKPNNNEEKFMNFLEATSKKRSTESNLQEEEESRQATKDQYGGLKRNYSTSVGLARID